MNNTTTFALISACNARVAAMQAENALWIARGQEPVYTLLDFMAEADTLVELAKQTVEITGAPLTWNDEQLSAHLQELSPEACGVTFIDSHDGSNACCNLSPGHSGSHAKYELSGRCVITMQGEPGECYRCCLGMMHKGDHQWVRV